ncbi:hypothetical protein GS534_13270 [Rhodococcus hoagii]|nr:hypothetical protein [Prescottella equi]
MNPFMKNGELASVETLTAVLRHFQWAPTGKMPGRYEVWQADELSDDEVIVPVDPSRGDYSTLLGRAYLRLERAYGSPVREMVDLIEARRGAALDLTKWEKETAFDAGLIPWQEGEKLYAAARSMLAASAKASREKRSFHGNASSHIAKRFLESALMGQTEIGSFVISAYTPSAERFSLSKAEEESSNRDMYEVSSRSGADILNTFEMSLQAARTGLDEFREMPRDEIFIERVPFGFSSEFAQALGTVAENGDAAIKVSRYSTVGYSDNRVSAEVAFNASEAPILQRVARVLASNREPEAVTLTGEVTLLQRSSDDPVQLVRLHVVRGAKVNSVRVRLTPEQYESALAAHRDEQLFRVSGRMEKDGKYFWLYDAHDIAVLEDPAGEAGLF